MYKSASKNQTAAASRITLADLQVDGEEFLSNNDRINAFKRALKACQAEIATCTDKGWKRHLIKKVRKLEVMRRGLGKRTSEYINFPQAFFEQAREILQPGLFQAICAAARRHELYKPMTEAEARARDTAAESLFGKLSTLNVPDDDPDLCLPASATNAADFSHG